MIAPVFDLDFDSDTDSDTDFDERDWWV